MCKYVHVYGTDYHQHENPSMSKGFLKSTEAILFSFATSVSSFHTMREADGDG